MIVVDASAMVETLVGRYPSPALFAALSDDLAAPHILDLEVLSVLRGLTLAGKIADKTADDARRSYFDLTITRYETEPLADRIWALRHRHTSYDAAYLALAEVLGATLVTCDRKLDSGAHAANLSVLVNGD